MHRIDNPTAVAVIPSPEPVGTPGFFSDAVIPTTPPTVLNAGWANAVQEELVGAVEGMDLTLDKGSRSQLLQAILRAASQGATANALINPDFRVWQRKGFGPFVATNTLGFHGPDRWLFKSGNAGAVLNLSQITLTSSLETSASGIETVLRWNKSVAGGAGEVSMVQRIERAQTFQSRKVVVAFDARKAGGADLGIVSVELIQSFGTGGSAPVATTLAAGAGLLIDSSWRRLVFTATLPTTVGKTVTGDNYLELRIKFAENVASDVYLTAFTVSRGNADPSFFQRPLAQELALCQRYFEASARGLATGAGGAGEDLGLWDTGYDLGAAVGTLSRRFETEKYDASGNPFVVWYSLAGTANAITEGAATAHAVTSLGLTGNRRTNGVPNITAPPATGTVRQFRAHWAAGYEIGSES